MKYFIEIRDHSATYDGNIYGKLIKIIELQITKDQEKWIDSQQGQLYFHNKYGVYPNKVNVEVIKITKEDMKEIKKAIKKSVYKEKLCIKKRLIENKLEIEG